jgi:hypothetical protein
MTTLPILLSPGFVPLVKNNDFVKAGQIIAQKFFHKEYIINLNKEFSVPSEKARKYIRKKPGDSVQEGDMLAIKKNFLGLSEEKIISKVAGIFSRYERDTGNLIITVESETYFSDIVSPVDGTVTMCDNNKIVISTDKDVFEGRKGAGGTISGEIFVLEDAFLTAEKESEESEISLYYALDSRAVGKIIVGKNFPKDLLIKSIGMGVIGVVGTEIRDEDIEYLSKRKMAVPIIEIDSKIIGEVIQWKGKKIYLNSPEKIILFLHA